MTKEDILGDKNRYAFEIERYFAILNKNSILSITDIYEKQNYNALDFLKNKNKQHISINSYLINNNFKSMGIIDMKIKVSLNTKVIMIII